MSERADVLRVQNDALLNEYHQLIRAQIRRVDEALGVLDLERGHLMAERDHLAKHLPTPEEYLQGHAAQLPTGREKSQQGMAAAQQKNALPHEVPKFIQKGPAS